MQQLFKRFEEPRIIYPKAELSNLFMQVLPHLRKIGTVEITKEVGAEIQESPLAVVFHCVKSKVRSICKIDFNYGEVTFSTDEKHQVIPEAHPEILRITHRKSGSNK